MDVLALPTYREGFPNVVLEANAAKKPAVVSSATGAIDSVVDGVTGLIVPVGDSRALAGALGRLLSNPSLATTMGHNAKTRAVSDFQPQRIWADVTAEYRHLLEARHLPLPQVSPAGCLDQRARSVHHA
jgi:glycosyltransferase involved in cell wall biosynthesis